MHHAHQYGYIAAGLISHPYVSDIHQFDVLRVDDDELSLPADRLFYLQSDHRVSYSSIGADGQDTGCILYFADGIRHRIAAEAVGQTGDRKEMAKDGRSDRCYWSVSTTRANFWVTKLSSLVLLAEDMTGDLIGMKI